MKCVIANAVGTVAASKRELRLRSRVTMCALAITAVTVVIVPPAAADSVAVKVTEVAGGVAYIAPGRAAGLVPGTKVRIRGRTFSVVEVTEKTAALRLDNGSVAIGDAGTATVTRGGVAAVEPLAKPRPPEAFAGQWPDPVMPATTQQPQAVPLGSGRAPGKSRVTVIGHGFGASDRSGATGNVEGRVIASFELMTDRPLGADVDVAGRAYARGIDRGTHVPVVVRAAQLRYGDARDPRLALGRLRYAASSLGPLDGGRASARLGSVEVAAFGGIVPDPVGGTPDPSASRFGGEVAYDDATASWQPRVALTAYGSTWNGTLDERRASVVASASRASIWLDGWADLQAFPSTNPWNAKPIELTGGGVTAQWRARGTHAGIDVTVLRPERSLRLDAWLPADWLCTRAPQPGDVSETCSGSDYAASTSASVGRRTQRWAIDAIGAFGKSHGIYRGFDGSGFVRGELRAGPGRAFVGGGAGRASFASWTAGELGAGFAMSRRLDTAVRYRLELLDYVASTGPYVVHSIAADGHHAISTALDLAVTLLATTGADRDALAMLATIVWRPLP